MKRKALILHIINRYSQLAHSAPCGKMLPSQLVEREMKLHCEIKELEIIRKHLDSLPIPMSKHMGVCLAVEEAFVNVVSYSECREIHFDTDMADGKLRIVISDDGKEFDPTKAPPPVIDPDNLRPGGLGISMVRKIMDSMEYERKDGKNILILKTIL